MTDPGDTDLLKGKKILLVEDNPMNIMVATKYLQKWQAQVDVAENGKEAIEAFSDHNLILMDLLMPEMDGYMTSEKMRHNGVTVPIIALTASTLLDVEQKILSAGMNDYVTKPFDPDELYEKIIHQLNKDVA